MNGCSITGAGLVLGGNSDFDGARWDDLAWPPRYDPTTDDSIHPRMRRRMSQLSCMVIRATRQAGGTDAFDGTPMLFATANGEINTINLILESLVDPARSVSPTHFHNSVHNAGPGYWTINTGRKAPTSTLTMGELSFEYALLDAWARLANGLPEIQVTAGDEAVDGPDWADPAHCTHDFCGSLRIGSDPGEDSLGSLRHIHVGVVSGPDAMACHRDGLVERFQPTDTIEDYACTGGTVTRALPEGARNPCSSLFHLLRFLLDPGQDGKLLIMKAGRCGDLASLVVEKGSGK